MVGEDLWKIEAKLWSGDSRDYLETLHPDCLMAFPPPAGIMAHDETLSSIRGSQRWRDVALTGQSLVRPSDDIAVLAYHVWAKRDGDAEAYSALCTSTYVADDGAWRMVQHQQTPS
ncbi:MAG: nuclear transport factor 2 family protein [Myxococcales bacterium]|nr:nuclear transport factor 2 family protein [Myxococcales bacterium]